MTATSAPKPPCHCDDTEYVTEQPVAAAPAGIATATAVVSMRPADATAAPNVLDLRMRFLLTVEFRQM
ncbi:hypothetical protein JCM9534A_09630 [Catenuloplanes indicus JCM 9534]